MRAILAAILGLGAPAKAAEPSLDVGRIVAIFRAIENGPPSNPWQFTEQTWAQYSKVPLHKATAAEHKRVAWAFTSSCCRYCLTLDLPITPKNVALFFHAGYGKVASGKINREERDYAQRTENLYREQP